MTEQERKTTKAAVGAIKDILKRLEYPKKQLENAANKAINKRKEIVEKLTKYKDEDDLRDAYGYGCITEEEYERLLDLMREGQEAIENDHSSAELALDYLKRYIGELCTELHALEFDLLPEKEKDRIRQQNYEIAMKREARRKAREEGNT